jgi:hypothetical protein
MTITEALCVLLAGEPKDYERAKYGNDPYSLASEVVFEEARRIRYQAERDALDRMLAPKGQPTL